MKKTCNGYKTSYRTDYLLPLTTKFLIFIYNIYKK